VTPPFVVLLNDQTRQETTMRKLIESTLVSLDGVIESPDQWALFDDESAERAMQQLDEYDAFVMGRVTYERLSARWAGVVGNPYIERVNAMPKHVASRTLRDPGWNATVLGPDAAAAIAELKQQPGKDLIKYGTSRFDDVLFREHLVDELNLWYVPVVVGAGQRLFEDVDTSSLNLRLIDERRLGNGSVVLSYAVG
jgi:dihydrofolate reductase